MQIPPNMPRYMDVMFVIIGQFTPINISMPHAYIGAEMIRRQRTVLFRALIRTI